MLLRHACLPAQVCEEVATAQPEVANSLIANPRLGSLARRRLVETLLRRYTLPPDTAELIAGTSTDADDLAALARAGERRVDPVLRLVGNDHSDHRVVDALCRRPLPKSVGEQIAGATDLDDQLRLHALRGAESARGVREGIRAAANTDVVPDLLAEAWEDDVDVDVSVASALLRRPDLARQVADTGAAPDVVAAFPLPPRQQRSLAEQTVRSAYTFGPDGRRRPAYRLTAVAMRTLQALAVRPDTHPEVRATIRGFVNHTKLVGDWVGDLTTLANLPAVSQRDPSRLVGEEIDAVIDRLEYEWVEDDRTQVLTVTIAADLTANPHLTRTHRWWLRNVVRRTGREVSRGGHYVRGAARVLERALDQGEVLDRSAVWRRLAHHRSGHAHWWRPFVETTPVLEGDPEDGADTRLPGRAEPASADDVSVDQWVRAANRDAANAAAHLEQRLGDDAQAWHVAIATLSGARQAITAGDLADVVHAIRA